MDVLKERQFIIPQRNGKSPPIKLTIRTFVFHNKKVVPRYIQNNKDNG